MPDGGIEPDSPDIIPASGPNPGLSINKSGLLRTFVDSGIQQAITDATSKLPADKHGAVFIVPDGEKLRFAGVARLPAGWSVMGVFDRSWKGKIDVQAALAWTF